MAGNGINAVRVYTMPPVWLLDAAARCGLRVMTSLAVERFVGYLADGKRRQRSSAPCGPRSSRSRAIRRFLCYCIGNEIPAPMVRWLGRDARRTLS